MAQSIMEEEWLAELDRLSRLAKAGGKGMLSMVELMEATGRGEDSLRRLLRRANKEGRLVVGAKSAVSLTGRTVMVPAYRITKKG